MSGGSIEKSVAEKPATKKKSTAAEAPKTGKRYEVEKLRANCMQLFHVTTSTFDGAMHKNKETKMTIEEAGAVINKWLSRKE